MPGVRTSPVSRELSQRNYHRRTQSHYRLSLKQVRLVQGHINIAKEKVTAVKRSQGKRERWRHFREEARQKASNAAKLRLAERHSDTERRQNAQSSGWMLQQAPGWERGCEKLCVFLCPQLYSSMDQFWCWWNLKFQSPVSKHPSLLQHPPQVQTVLCPVCGTAALHQHAMILWSETWKLCLLPFNHSLFLSGPICGFSTASSLLFLPDTSPKKRPVLFCTHVS